mmetsp:Transcript_11216/g.23839  ORF Transcript_11216/g.23839 Transcript_11216/m.23839 type:complete len:203 (+) Transcript_11216:154-762(+)
MKQIAWASLSDTGDQSPYVTQLVAALQTSVPHIVKPLSTAHRAFLFDKFVSELSPNFVGRILKTGRINEAGMQQLLIDTQAIKDALLVLPSAVNPDTRPSASFQRLVGLEMGKPEALLKVLLSEPDDMTDTYKRLVANPRESEFAKLLEVKGLKPREVESLKDIGASVSSAVSSAVSSSASITGTILPKVLRDLGRTNVPPS